MLFLSVLGCISSLNLDYTTCNNRCIWWTSLPIAEAYSTDFVLYIYSIGDTVNFSQVHSFSSSTFYFYSLLSISTLVLYPCSCWSMFLRLPSILTIKAWSVLKVLLDICFKVQVIRMPQNIRILSLLLALFYSSILHLSPVIMISDPR